MQYTRYFYVDDNQKTIENVKALLRKYPRYKRISKRKAGQLKSPSMDGMPRSDSYGNQIESKIINQIEAEQIVMGCQYSIEAIEDSECRKILYDKYIKGYEDTAIRLSMHMAERTYYRKLKTACLSFADVYGWQELRVQHIYKR